MAGFSLSIVKQFLAHMHQARISAVLKDAGKLPRHFEVVDLKPGYMVTVFDSPADTIMAETAKTGMDRSLPVAWLKALVEHVERMAYEEGAHSGHFACQTDRSDGFAAFPHWYFGRNAARQRARFNAWLEATERFVWANWWDDHGIAHDELELSCLSPGDLTNLEPLRRQISERFANHELRIISPAFSGAESVEVLILLCLLEGGGVVSGGAAGHRNSRGATIYRGASELLRHAMALGRYLDKGKEPTNLYESRLVYFGVGNGDTAVKSRLETRSREALSLPRLEIDVEVPHQFKNIVAVHRCLYQDQPPFVGGTMERLCL